jgi:hypothetical protein
MVDFGKISSAAGHQGALGYGGYIDGLEEDFWKIPGYYGRDFIEPKSTFMRSCFGKAGCARSGSG